MLAETCLIWFWYRTSPYPLPPNIANHLWIIYEWELLSSLVANAVKRFFTLKYYTSDMLHQADFAYTHKDSNNNDSYQVVEWRNWPRRLKNYIGALGQIERVTKLKLYTYISTQNFVRDWNSKLFEVELGH